MSLRRSLTLKLTLAFLVVSLLGVALVAGYTSVVTVNEFQRLAYQRALNDLTIQVQNYYQRTGSLAGVQSVVGPPRRNQAGDNPTPNQPPPPVGSGPQGVIPFGLADPQGVVYVHGDGYPDTVPHSILAASMPIELNGQVIAYALPPTKPVPYSQQELDYLDRTNRALVFGGVGAVILALVVGVILARTITWPVRDLTNAARRMAKGELAQTVRIQSEDEVGELAKAFNHLSADLTHADQVRRQMTADIAHELRNPLTVISGYIDMMQNGYVAITPERFQTIQTEAQHLTRLVDDLRTLSLADVGALTLHREPVATGELLRHVANTYKDLAEQQKVALVTEAPNPLPDLNVDVGRMVQVLGNLVSNALRYTPPGGQVRLAAEAQTDSVLLKVQDTGGGIGPDDLPFIFERFYRTDKSRQEHQGGSGLGLAIAKAIVEAHRGAIWAESDLGHGTRFTIRLGLT